MIVRGLSCHPSSEFKLFYIRKAASPNIDIKAGDCIYVDVVAYDQKYRKNTNKQTNKCEVKKKHCLTTAKKSFVYMYIV